ncbi:cupin domain-containing protein [Pectobacterium parvum]|uniref:Cupin domain-containing protein n=1 Tax=Pectobacterium parvum TaxID=2778550 RepID=A0AAP9IJ79_9GAMM|nr:MULTISPECIES: cupin domain-containing protein [Pectobacterium]GKW41090.1 cupin [Pectobacterium carotovorum subsp. carotovorum]KFX18657.1 cupin [Pectobacterium parvum]KHS99214.1 cupin [Pectobacterium parvum]QHQ26110.1 cupin domain-containing protein [Pectobacterium parvum]UFK40985.1 cupin domain-containing protein [Pectobacterium parvum]
MKENTLPAAQALVLHELITPTEHGIASCVLARTDGGNVTLFAFDQGQGLSEHSAPYDALVMVLEGELLLTIGGEPVVAQPGTLVRMPANVPHAVDAQQSSRMLLTMLKTLKTD